MSSGLSRLTLGGPDSAHKKTRRVALSSVDCTSTARSNVVEPHSKRRRFVHQHGWILEGPLLVVRSRRSANDQPVGIPRIVGDVGKLVPDRA